MAERISVVSFQGHFHSEDMSLDCCSISPAYPGPLSGTPVEPLSRHNHYANLSVVCINCKPVKVHLHARGRQLHVAAHRM